MQVIFITTNTTDTMFLLIIPPPILAYFAHYLVSFLFSNLVATYHYVQVLLTITHAIKALF